MRLLSPLCSPRVFRASGAENLYSRRTELAYCQSLCGYYPRCAVPEFFAPAARKTCIAAAQTFTSYLTLCGYYIPSVRKKQVLTERGRKDIIRKEKQALSPPRVSGRRCGPLFDPKSPARAESPRNGGNPCAAEIPAQQEALTQWESLRGEKAPAQREFPVRRPLCAAGLLTHRESPRGGIPIPARRGFPTRWE